MKNVSIGCLIMLFFSFPSRSQDVDSCEFLIGKWELAWQAYQMNCFNSMLDVWEDKEEDPISNNDSIIEFNDAVYFSFEKQKSLYTIKAKNIDDTLTKGKYILIIDSNNYYVQFYADAMELTRYDKKDYEKISNYTRIKSYLYLKMD